MASSFAKALPAQLGSLNRSLSLRTCRTILVRQQLPARTFTASAAVFAKRYTRDHEWVELDDTNGTNGDSTTATIGISTYAAKALGDVVFVEMPAMSSEIGQGDAIGAVESVKSASDINAPVSGKIIAVNSLLEEKAGTINKYPEEGGTAGGWFVKLEVEAEKVEKEMKELMNAEEYKKFTEEA